MLSNATEAELRRQLLPRRWREWTEFLGPTRTVGGAWTITQYHDEGPCHLSLEGLGVELEHCALTSQRRAKPLSRILGQFLIDAGPFRHMVRSNRTCGMWLPFDTSHRYFLPQRDGGVVAVHSRKGRRVSQLLTDWTKAADGAPVTLYATAADFLKDTAGRDLYHRLTSTDAGVAEIIKIIAQEWDMTDLESLIDTAERLAGLS